MSHGKKHVYLLPLYPIWINHFVLCHSEDVISADFLYLSQKSAKVIYCGDDVAFGPNASQINSWFSNQKFLFQWAGRSNQIDRIKAEIVVVL